MRSMELYSLLILKERLAVIQKWPANTGVQTDEILGRAASTLLAAESHHASHLIRR